jgi:diguanylate cyclase (GGDEF)-like protein
MWQAMKNDQHWQGEIWDRRKNAEIYPKWMGITAVRDASGQLTHYVAIFSDISERKAAQDKIEHLAHHDPLTGLPNRLLLYDRFAQAVAHADRTHSKVALLFLDLDRFKTINDSLGHPVGDKLLQTLAGRLQECIRDTDTISRQGGDEFVILATELRDPDTAAGIAQKMLEQVRQTVDIDGHALNASFSIGISLYPDDGADFDTLLQKSDTAMYHAKDAGRNAYRFFTQQMNIDALERLLIQNRLRRAVEENEFILHYQPQIDLASGRVVGAEALVRWNNPELGLVGPTRFIPIAEESGQIVALGEWVLYEACRQAQAWRIAGLPALTMAVNVSALQIQRGNFVETVIAALSASGLDAAGLELELTESILIQNVEKTLETVRKLQSLGIKISIDDFGTGYSSLSYLKRFAIDRIKIDRSFVRDISSDPEDAAIVRAIIQMARSLHLTTLAEGAETQAQVDYLRQEGCEEIQGFFYSRPLTAENFVEFLSARNR